MLNLPPDQQLVRANRRNLNWRATHSAGSLLEEPSATWTAIEKAMSTRTRTASETASYQPALLCWWRTMTVTTESVLAVLAILSTTGLIPIQTVTGGRPRRLNSELVIRRWFWRGSAATTPSKHWSNKNASTTFSHFPLIFETPYATWSEVCVTMIFTITSLPVLSRPVSKTVSTLQFY